MPQEILIPFLIVFAGCFALVMAFWLIVGSVTGRRRKPAGSASEPSLLLAEIPEKKTDGIANQMDNSFAQMIARTGIDMSQAAALMIIVLFGVLAAGAVFVWQQEKEPLLAIPAFLLGAMLPFIFFMWRTKVYARMLRSQLPDTFFMLARAMQTGRSAEQAFHLVGEQGTPPMSREFARIDRQLELGLPLPRVLEGAANRLQLTDFSIFVSVVNLHRAAGGNLPGLLDRLAASTRDRNQFEGQYRAATVLGRWSAAFIAAVSVLILSYTIFGRPYGADEKPIIEQFFSSTMGITMFCCAIGLELLGGFFLWLFLRNDY